MFRKRQKYDYIQKKGDVLPEYLLSRFIVTEDNHWVWVATKNKDGYGTLNGKLAHRLTWVETKGIIPEVTPCVLHKNSYHRRDCVNPDHLYLGTQKQNIKDAYEIGTAYAGKNNSIKTHCPQGHEYNEDNTYTWKDGVNYRACKICKREKTRIRRLHNKNRGKLLV